MELRLDENVPHVPKNICQGCKKIIVAFYGLRKNFIDNEAVLMGKLTESKNPAISNLMRSIEMFLREHEKEQITINRYPDQLVIRLEKSLK